LFVYLGSAVKFRATRHTNFAHIRADKPIRFPIVDSRAVKLVQNLIYGKKVGIKVQKKNDGYERPVVWVYTPDDKDVGGEMLKAGMAWHFKKYDDSDKYGELENIARTNKIGLWSEKEPVAPWDYREIRKNSNK
jgi:endonuclease YncB( thermonuclease family)